MERRYNRYTTNKATEILSGLRKLKEESLMDKVTEVEITSEQTITGHEAFTEIFEMLEKSLPKELVELYIEPIVTRGDIVVLQYKGYTFELRLR